MDEDRIRNIARAICRAAHLDPDQPAETSTPCTMMRQDPGTDKPAPAWTLFRQDAERLCARHTEIGER